ncbi:phosphorylase family protein [Edaphobacter bradus]|uniref:phosphorylase family protein n=1 Tax=Edaphobacter bradus TaxID=2259016 RepID=UPI0021E0DAAC|nr:nucleoside phosphorylase [Edaphobacter bradus]
MRVGIIAALPGELKPLVKGWKRVKASTPKARKWVLRRGEDNADEWIAVCAGMGAEAARRAFAEAECDGALEVVLSVGWAGALSETIQPEAVVVPSVVIDAQTGESFVISTTVDGALRLVTTARVADAKEKARLWESYGAVAVDMEAATVARLAEMRKIPLVCIKAISDGRDARLPDLNRFVDRDGRMRMLPFLVYVAVRPGFWGPLMRLGSHSAAGAKAMRDTINAFMEGKDAERADRTGGVD